MPLYACSAAVTPPPNDNDNDEDDDAAATDAQLHQAVYDTQRNGNDDNNTNNVKISVIRVLMIRLVMLLLMMRLGMILKQQKYHNCNLYSAPELRRLRLSEGGGRGPAPYRRRSFLENVRGEYGAACGESNCPHGPFTFESEGFKS